MKPNLTPEAERLLWLAVGNAETHPETFEISKFGSFEGPFIPSCETPCCIAAHICFIADGEVPQNAGQGNDSPIKVRACEILDLDIEEDEAYYLFEKVTFLKNRITVGNLRDRVGHWLAYGV